MRKEIVQAPRKKRRNTSAKGAAAELRVKKTLEERGYLVHRTIRTPVSRGKFFFSNSNDIFGVFDLEAWAPWDEGPLYVQVTMRDHARDRMRKVAPVARRAPKSCQIEVWAWVEGRKSADPEAQTFRVWRWDQERALEPSPDRGVFVSVVGGGKDYRP